MPADVGLPTAEACSSGDDSGRAVAMKAIVAFTSLRIACKPRRQFGRTVRKSPRVFRLGHVRTPTQPGAILFRNQFDRQARPRSKLGIGLDIVFEQRSPGSARLRVRGLGNRRRQRGLPRGRRGGQSPAVPDVYHHEFRQQTAAVRFVPWRRRTLGQESPNMRGFSSLPRLLEAIERGLVPQSSRRRVGRFLLHEDDLPISFSNARRNAALSILNEVS